MIVQLSRSVLPGPVASRFKFGVASPQLVLANAATNSAFGTETGARMLYFLGQLGEPSEALLERFTNVDFKHEVAFVAVVAEDAHQHIVGVSRYGTDDAGLHCECAVTVEDEWQDQGLGTLLMRRWCGRPLVLASPREVVGYLAAAALAGVVSPTCATLVLKAAHVIATAQMGLVWTVWWTGDLMGVLIATPITLALIGKPRAAWATRRFSVGLPMLLTTLLAARLRRRNTSLMTTSWTKWMMTRLRRRRTKKNTGRVPKSRPRPWTSGRRETTIPIFTRGRGCSSRSDA